MNMNKVLAPICVFFCLSCGNKNESEIDINRQYLEGTKWKLTGFVDQKTGKIIEPEPKDFSHHNVNDENNWGRCDCFTIYFDIGLCGVDLVPKPTVSIMAVSNLFCAAYEVDYVTSSIYIAPLFGTDLCEIGDGYLYFRAFETVQSFSLKKNVLKLYYNDNNNYLLFKLYKP